MLDIHLLTIGAAAVIDSVLLVALLERPNRRHIPAWMVFLVFAAWLWHASSFVHWLLAETSQQVGRELDWTAMLGMSIGLLMLPAATVHGAMRLHTTGTSPRPPIRWFYVLPYLPLIAIVPIAAELRTYEGRYVTELAQWQIPYLVWLSIANCVGAVGFYRVRNRFHLPRGRQFFVLTAVSLLAMTLLVNVVVLTGLHLNPRFGSVLLLVVTLSPVIPAIVFGYFVMRFRFVPLVLERTLVFGAVLAGLLLFHRLVFSQITQQLSDQLQFDVGILEGILGITLILAWRPLRQRVSEALRYLVGTSVTGFREETRQLSVDLSARAEQDPQQLAEWFRDRIAQIFRVEDPEIVIRDASNGGDANEEGTDIVSLHRPKPVLDAAACPNLFRVFQKLGRRSRRHLTPRETQRADFLDIFDRAAASAIVYGEHDGVQGLMLTGRRPWNQYLNEEAVNTLVLLLEQLVVTIRNGRLQSERLEAERRAMQHEKLSVLGLLAGSIAHEIKNPLSSIKTIASVLAEDLDGSEHSEDIELIRSEIKRLSLTTHQLLEFARPNHAPEGTACPAIVVEQILQVVRHLAGKTGVNLHVDCSDIARSSFVAASEATLREIYLNLVVNAIDAAGTDGRVTIECAASEHRNTITIRDSGPGISAEIQNHLFEPFQTNKVNGTGLGLYIVSKRVQELSGQISCRTSSEKGTSFVVSLPAGEKQRGNSEPA